MWFSRYKLTQALVVDPLYLQHSYSQSSIDYRHWGIPLGRRFRSLKLWFVIRNYGVSGLQAYVREHCRLAKIFEKKVEKDPRFVVTNEVKLGLVCFRLKGSNDLNKKLLTAINASGRLHMVPASANDFFVIRFCVCAQNATEEDIDYAWVTIADIATGVIKKMEENEDEEAKERLDVVKMMEAKSMETLRYKRSFFVRMVSDPKLYNPKMTERRQRQTLLGHNPNHSWVSWPVTTLMANKPIDETSRESSRKFEKHGSREEGEMNTIPYIIFIYIFCLLTYFLNI